MKGNEKKDRISKFSNYLTKATSQHTFRMHLEAILKSNTKVISCSILHNITWFLQPAEWKSLVPFSGLSLSKKYAKLSYCLQQDSNSWPLGLQATALSTCPTWLIIIKLIKVYLNFEHWKNWIYLARALKLAQNKEKGITMCLWKFG